MSKARPRWVTWDDFIQPGTTDVLRNRFGITDAHELERVERIHAALRISELARTPLSGKFDLAHLQAIHRHIFTDVYEWAGVLRPFPLSKGGSEFCRPQFIVTYAAEVFGKLHDTDLLRGLDTDTFVSRAADLLGDVNALHPFREGNGRAQRVFLQHVAIQAGRHLVWSIGNEQRNIDASIAAHRGDPSDLRALIRDALHK